jgi:hypothetical protein
MIMTRLDPAADAFDEALDRSAPRATTDAEIDQELTLMVRRARSAARQRPRPWGRRIAVAGAILALAAGGATTAAATGLWSPWAEDPAVIYSYELPSGVWCEVRTGNVMAHGRPDVVAAIEDILENGDVFARADIDAAITESRAAENSYMGKPAGHGTDYYNADNEYRMAVDHAVTLVLFADLEKRIPDYAGVSISWEGEANCPGATFGYDQ